MGSIVRELRTMLSGKWLTSNPLRIGKALLVTHRVFNTSRAINRAVAKGNRIKSWNQGMGKEA